MQTVEPTFYGHKRETVTRLEAKELPAVCWEHVSENVFTQRVIVCAALRWPDKDLVLGVPRHYGKSAEAILDSMIAKGVLTEKEMQVVGVNQGFLDNFGNYWTRPQALLIATHAKQLEGRKKNGSPDDLYSEDLY